MVAKNTRKLLAAVCLLLFVATGVQSPVGGREISSTAGFVELDDTVAEGAIQTDRSKARSLHVLSLNLNRLFDDIDDGNDEKILSSRQFHQRLQITASSLAERYKLPDVIALQEAENLNVLQQLAQEIRRHYSVSYRPVLIEGHDVSGIDVGYLVRSDLEIREFATLFAEKRLSFDDLPLFSRPPLYLEICRQQSCFALLNLHLRSMRGLNSDQRGDRVARKRRQQAETIAAWSDRWQKSAQRRSLLILGDFNALTPSDRHIDVTGTIRGNPDNRAARLPAKDLVDPDLVDLTLRIPASRRYSFVYRGRRQQLDYMFVNRDFDAGLQSIAFARIDRNLSDHAGLYARFVW